MPLFGRAGFLLQVAGDLGKKEAPFPPGGFVVKLKKILAPTDFSELSRLGVGYALELARGWGASVTVYHIADAAELANYKARSLDELIERQRQSLSQFLDQYFAELVATVDVRKLVEVGAPASNIVAEAEKSDYDLIVMSTHGRTGIAHMLIGSVTEQVLRNAPCPVFSVPPPKDASKAGG
jgi:nucleotide-binding universal stress UspA family protein